MLKRNNLIILVIVLAVLAGLSLMQTTRHRRATSRSNTEPVLSQAVEPDQIKRVDIGYGTTQDAVVLEHQPDGWVVASAYGHAASPTRVQTLLDNLNDLGGEYRSDAADVLPDYGFTDSTVVTITAYGPDSDQPLLALDIGAKPQGSIGNFVKLPNSNAVYLTRKGLLGNLGLYSGPGMPQSKFFLELQAYKADRDSVEALTLHDEGSVIALEKEFSEPEPNPADTTGIAPEVNRKVYEWKITKPHRKAALKTKADAILGAVCSIRAVDIDDPNGDPADYGLAEPQKWVEVQLHDGTTATLNFGAKREAEGDKPGGIYFQVVGDKTVWVIGEYIENNIFKSYQDLLPEDK
jgi:hypothetical protein